MIVAIACVAAIVLSIVGTAVAAIALCYAFGMPLIVALPFLVWTYLSLWFVVPLCLLVHLAVFATTRGDLWVYMAALLLAVVLYLLWDLLWAALFAGKGGGSDRQLWTISFSGMIGTVTAHWLVFWWAQRRRRRQAAPTPAAPA